MRRTFCAGVRAEEPLPPRIFLVFVRFWFGRYPWRRLCRDFLLFPFPLDAPPFSPSDRFVVIILRRVVILCFYPFARSLFVSGACHFCLDKVVSILTF